MNENGFPSPLPPILSFIPLKMMVEMRNPEMTKKMSTPTKPDLKTLSGKAWKRTTEMTAMARSPSISGRYLRLLWELEVTDEVLLLFRGGGILSKHLIYKHISNKRNQNSSTWNNALRFSNRALPANNSHLDLSEGPKFFL